MKASHTLAEHMYKQAQQGSGAQPGEGAEAQTSAAGGATGDGSGPVDADFEVVNDDKKK